ncbi:sugar ABC transporter substrate-binding protein [Siminovitchia terrae]|uniref:Sugar ABC transporter substrate-binding protein n=1 Tax=Siminovitchia terrae TaxID=1914933 RepID=A0A429XEB4_SIMTE|nr:sugar ABC transporter substrate-binding protein [Siminovitchia terrae]RST61729.1 sugar ABC transporter substrate-binding protein [Siminovitchia terrae]
MRRLVAFLTVLGMSLSILLVGCSVDEDSSNAKSGGNSESSSGTGNPDVHEIYKLLPKQSLSGVVNPYMEERTNIDKALPKTPKDRNKIVIGWTEITSGNPWFVELIDAATKTAKKYGYDLKVQVADSSVEQQSQHIDSFIAQGVDIIVVDPTDILGVVSGIQRAVDAGIPVITVGSAPDASAPVITTITSSVYLNGFEAGKYVATQYGDDEEINAAMIIGVMGNSTSESRLNGMIGGIIHERMGGSMSKEDAMLEGYKLFEELKKKGSFEYPEVKFSVRGAGTGNWTEEGGLAAAEDLLVAHASSINIILADNDWMGMGAIKAIENADKKGEILVASASDGAREALEYIKSGDLLVTGPYNSKQLGEEAINLIYKIFEEDFDANNLPLETHLEAAAIVKENVDEYYDPDKSNPFFKYKPLEFKTVKEVLDELE